MNCWIIVIMYSVLKNNFQDVKFAYSKYKVFKYISTDFNKYIHPYDHHSCSFQ